MAKIAARKAGIQVVVEGEKEFRASLSAMKTEFKGIEGELAKVQSDFATQRNTLQAVEAETEKYNKMQKSLQDRIQAIQQRTEVYNTRLKSLGGELQTAQERLDKANEALQHQKETMPDNTASWKQYEDEVAKAQKEVDRIEAEINDVTKAINKNNKEEGDAYKELGKVNTILDKYKKYQQEAKNSTDGTTKSLDKYGKEVNKTEEEIGSLKDLLKGTVLESFLDIGEKGVEAFKKIWEAIAECVQEAADFETAIVKVSKTVDGLTREDISETIYGLMETIPLSYEELAEIAEGAGRYGISAENLASYIETIAALQSSTNITDTDTFARIVNLLGTEVDEYENLASALVKLGNNVATDENSILELADTIASTGHLIGLTDAEVLALSATLAANGGVARGAGTAMQRIMQDMHEAIIEGDEDLENFASVAGMSSEAFKELFNDSAMDAIVAVIDGLASMSEEGENYYEAMENIGITTTQEKNAVTKLISTWGSLETNIEMANTAFEENVALTEEFSEAVNTANSNTELLKNSWDKFKIAVGEQFSVDGVKKALTNVLNYVSEHMIDLKTLLFNTFSGGFLAQYEPVISAMKSIVEFMSKGEWSYGSLFGGNDSETDTSGTGGHKVHATVTKSDVATTYENATEAVKEYTDAVEDSAETESTTSDALQDTMDLLDAVKEAYAEYKESVIESLDSSFDALDNFDEKAGISLKDFRKNLEENTKSMETYAENFQKVMDSDLVSEEMKEYIQGLGYEEAYNIVKELANANEDTINKINEDYANYQSALDSTATLVANESKELENTVAQLVEESNQETEMFASGYHTVQGLINGLESREKVLKSTASRISNIVVETYNRINQIASPSKKMKQLGVYTVEGLIEGYESMEGKLEKSAQTMAVKAQRSYDNMLVGFGGDINVALNGSKDYTDVLNSIDRKVGKYAGASVGITRKVSRSQKNDLESELIRAMLY